MRSLVCASIVWAIAVGGPSGRALARDEPGTTLSSDLTEVLTSGNSAANSLGFKAALTWIGGRSTLAFRGGGLRTRSTTYQRTAVASAPGVITLDERSLTATSAESFFAHVRLDRKVAARFSWNAGSGWERDRLAGIDARIVTFAGAGLDVLNRSTTDFKISLAATVTRQRELVANPLTPDDSVGGRVTATFRQKLGHNTTLRQSLMLDEDFQLARDVRLDALTELEVGMSRHLALKTSLRLRYDNLPPLAQLTVVDPLGVPTGDLYTAPLRKLDSTFTIAFVLSFRRAPRPPAPSTDVPPTSPPTAEAY